MLALAGSADAYRLPVAFSVLNDGTGQPTFPNDVLAFSPDGAHVFRSGTRYPGGWPDGTNLLLNPATTIGMPDLEEIDALSRGEDLVVIPAAVQQGMPIEFFFSVNGTAVGSPGIWAPDVFSEAPQAAGDVYFAWPQPWPYGGNHLGVPEIMLGLDPPTPDDLDALLFDLPGPPEPRFPIYFSVDRASCGLPGTAVMIQCNSPAPPAQAADVFLSWGNGTNQLFANEALMGLDWNDDNIDAMALYDSSPQGGPNHLVDPGIDFIYFSVDWLTNGLPGTAVNVEAQIGNIQGDVFFSDFSGSNWKVLDGSQLGLLEPTPPLPFTPDEDDLDGLETDWWMDTDGDQIPDIVDNCPGVPNPMQLDGDLNGMGDACDPTGVELGEATGPVFGRLAAEPSPFRDETRVRYALERAAHVSLEVFAVDGRRVRSLENGLQPGGPQVVPWDGRDDAGRPAAPGVYWLKLSAGGRTATAKVVRAQ